MKRNLLFLTFFISVNSFAQIQDMTFDICQMFDSGIAAIKSTISIDVKNKNLILSNIDEYELIFINNKIVKSRKKDGESNSLTIKLDKIRKANEKNDEALYGVDKESILLFPKNEPKAGAFTEEENRPYIVTVKGKNISLIGLIAPAGSVEECYQLKI